MPEYFYDIYSQDYLYGDDDNLLYNDTEYESDVDYDDDIDWDSEYYADDIE